MDVIDLATAALVPAIFIAWRRWKKEMTDV
jgi:hypothetical protein